MQKKIVHKYKPSLVSALNVNKNERVAGGEANSQLLIGTVSSVSFVGWQMESVKEQLPLEPYPTLHSIH